MNASDLDLENIRPIDLNGETLKPGSKATPFSTLIWAVASDDMATVEAQIADDIEWGLMPYNNVVKGKDEVMPWFNAASAEQKEPIIITDAVTQDWGVFEYWKQGVYGRSSNNRKIEVSCCKAQKLRR